MKNRSASLIRAAALSFALAGTAYASGGPFGGNIYALRADPSNAARVYATTSNGIFRSDDNGATWASKEVGLTAPHASNGVLALGASTLWTFDTAGQLHRSTNAGDSWTATGYTAPSGVLGAVFSSLAEGEGSKVWFAAGTHGLQISTDSGATFTAAAGLPAGQTFVSVATDPANRAHVIASTTTSCDVNAVCPVYVSSNGGASWSTATLSGTLPATGGFFAQHIIAVAYASGATYALYGDPNFTQCAPTCGYAASVLRSTDGGLTWSGHPIQEVEPPASIAVSPVSNNTVWVDANKSIDGGVTFAPLSSTGRTTNGTLVPTVSTVAVSAGYGTTPRLWLGTQFAGVYATSNDGANWSPSDEGLEATDIRSVVVSPADSTVVYAAYGDSLQDPSQALFRSGAGGAWSTSNHLLNAYQLRTVLIDPTTASTVGSTTMYAVGNGFDNSSAFYSSTYTRNSGIYKSVDGGANWVTESGGLPPFFTHGVNVGYLRTIIADPRSCAGSSGPTGAVCTSGPLQTLYVTGSGRSSTGGTHLYRVMKSTDGGVNWADSSTGLPDDIVSSDPSGCPAQYVGGVTPIVMDPADSRVLYIGTFAEGFDSSCNATPPTIASGVYKSVDAGAHWAWTSTGLRDYDGTTAGAAPGSSSVLDTLSLAIDASNPNTLWVSTNDGNGGFGAPGELFKSTDAGAHWTLSNAGVTGPDVRALLADPSTPGTVYAASGGIDAADPGGVFKSTDGGATWQSISVGLPAFSATALALDPQDSSILYAGTTGGVYSLVQATDTDGDGVPDAVEDAGANNGDANNDGTKDRLQANVATVPGALVGTYGWHSGVAGASRPAARAQTMSDFFIKALPSGTGTDCHRTVDASMIDTSTLGADAVAHHGTYTYPNGLARFELPQCVAVNVDVVYNSATFGAGWTWRYYGPSVPGDASTIGWHDASSLLLSRVNGDWKIHLANGQFGSYRPAAAGSILFEGGPAYNETIFTDNLEP